MARGIPAIISDQIGCGPDLVPEARSGAIFPVGDIDALGRKIVALSWDPDRLKTMGREAQERVLTPFFLDRVVEGTLAAIHATVRI